MISLSIVLFLQMPTIYLVSHDRDFDVLKKIEFPKIRVIDTNTFKEILKIDMIDK